jgi:hypothetical protein
MVNSGPRRFSTVVSADSGTMPRRGCARSSSRACRRLSAVFALRLDVDLPLPAEPVEVVDEDAAHVALERLVDVGERTPCFRTLSRSTLTKTWGTTGRKVVDRPVSSFRLARRRHELVQVVGEERDVLAGAVLEDEGEAARRADAGDRRRGERRTAGPRDLASSRLRWALMAGVALLRLGPLRPGLEVDEEEPAVGVVDRAEQAEPDDRRVGLHARRVLQDLLDLRGRPRSSAAARRRWAAGGHVEVALVLVRQEGGGQPAGPRSTPHGGEAARGRRS